MTGCKGYDLRGSDARTEIERTKEADTPGEIPGRSGLQADRRTETSLSCGAHGSAAKKWRNIIMTLSMKEKKILYAFACPSHHNKKKLPEIGAITAKMPGLHPAF